MMSEDQVDSGNEALEYPELPIELSQPRFSTLFKYFGPGAIIASITIGSGETVFASRSGAVFGYSLLWLFLAAAIAKGLQIYCGSRYITLTGEHRRTLPVLTPLEKCENFRLCGIETLCAGVDEQIAPEAHGTVSGIHHDPLRWQRVGKDPTSP